MSQADQLLNIAVAHHQAGRLAEAEQAYHKLLGIEPLNTDGLRLLGGLYLQSKQCPRAIEYLEKAARRDPRNTENLVNLGLALRGLGRIDEAATTYRQAIDIDNNYMDALNNLGGLLQENGRMAEGTEIYARILKMRPDYAPAHFNYANSLMQAGNIVDGIRHYEEALRLKPDFLEAMINLGMALGQLGKGDLSRQWMDVARSWFDKALQADPNNVVALNNIANVLRQKGDTEEALSYYRKALALRPDYAEAALNMSTSLRDLNRIDEAIEACQLALRHQPHSADARINLGALMQDLARHEEAVVLFSEALQRKPASVDAKWNKALSLLSLGEYREGWQLHEIGLGVPYMRGIYPSPQTRWNGEDINGKRLLLWAEQGLGDTLQFIRYGALCKARGAKIIVFCPRPLRALLANCPFIDTLPEGIDEKNFDLHAPMMSLPFIFGTTLETIPVDIPYLQISEAARTRWSGKIPDKKGFKVGLVWAGNPRPQQINAHMADKRRSIDLETLRPLFGIEGVQWVNLQMGDKAGQIDACGLRARFLDPMGEVKDFEDTGAILEQLDLVLSVDTSVVHLAGGMGKTVWVLSRYDACWRWLRNRAANPWYPTARIFGQKDFGAWDGVIAEVRDALNEKINRDDKDARR